MMSVKEPTVIGILLDETVREDGHYIYETSNKIL
jgi:hypothetical protein